MRPPRCVLQYPTTALVAAVASHTQEILGTALKPCKSNGIVSAVLAMKHDNSSRTRISCGTPCFSSRVSWGIVSLITIYRKNIAVTRYGEFRLFWNLRNLIYIYSYFDHISTKTVNEGEFKMYYFNVQKILINTLLYLILLRNNLLV